MKDEDQLLRDKYLQKFHDLLVYVILLVAGIYLWRHADSIKKLFQWNKPPEKTATTHIEPVWEGSAIVSATLDGDTLEVQTEQHPKVVVRLAGVDAPEISNDPREANQPMAEESRVFVSQLVAGRALKMAIYAVDRGTRPVVVLSLDEEPINEICLKNGMAELNSEYLKSIPDDLRERLQKAQAEARRSSHGIWALAPYESPAAYRIRTKRR